MSKLSVIYFSVTMLFLSVPLAGSGVSTPAPATDWECRLFRAYLDKDMSTWLSLILAAERSLQPSGNKEEMFRLTLALYGYTAYLTGERDKALARVYLNKLESYIARLKTMKYTPSRVAALEIGVIAFRMSLDPASAVTEGPKLLRKINRAAEAYPGCPYILTEKGNADFHRPAVWGGSFKKAAGHYRRAVDLFRKAGGDNTCSWFYLNTLVQLRKAAAKAGMEAEKQHAGSLIRELVPSWQIRAD